ncbi:phosphate ABC transporter permease family protein [Alishewanella longhuensis]
MAVAYQFGIVRSRLAGGNNSAIMHSRPHHYGMMVGLWAVFPPLSLCCCGTGFHLVLFKAWSWPLFRQSILPDGEQAAIIMRRISNLAANFGIVAEAAEWDECG